MEIKEAKFKIGDKVYAKDDESEAFGIVEDIERAPLTDDIMYLIKYTYSITGNIEYHYYYERELQPMVIKEVNHGIYYGRELNPMEIKELSHKAINNPTYNYAEFKRPDGLIESGDIIDYRFEGDRLILVTPENNLINVLAANAVLKLKSKPKERE